MYLGDCLNITRARVDVDFLRRVTTVDPPCRFSTYELYHSGCDGTDVLPICPSAGYGNPHFGDDLVKLILYG